MQKQKGFIPIIIAIIVAIAAVGAGGYFAYQYFNKYPFKTGPLIIDQNQDQKLGGDRDEHGCIGSAGYSWCEAKQKCLRSWEEPCETKQQADFSGLNRDELLHKLFPNLTFEDGKADLSQSNVFAETNLYLKKSFEDYFVNKQGKSLLLMAQLDGVAHAGGLYHAYLGVFDENGNLLTPVSTFPKLNAEYDFYLDKAQFGGDGGNFGFYDCSGIKYILFVSSGCPNGSCCSDRAYLYRINNGNFEKVQEIDKKFFTDSSLEGYKITMSAEKLLVKKVPASSDNGCRETNYKGLSWDKNTCRFITDKIVTDPTAGWKTYKNDQYGFEFKYPSAYVVRSGQANLDFLDNYVIDNGQLASSMAYSIWIRKNINSYESLKSAMQSTDATVPLPGAKVEETVLAGQKAVRFSYDAVAGGYTGTVYNTGVLLGDGLAFVLAMQENANEAEYFNILSTFKFTK